MRLLDGKTDLEIRHPTGSADGGDLVFPRMRENLRRSR